MHARMRVHMYTRACACMRTVCILLEILCRDGLGSESKGAGKGGQ